MRTLLEIVLLLVGLLIIVLFHEGGHFLAGKLVKFTCDEFVIGMGHKVLEKEHNGTKYVLKAIPLGGICRFKEFKVDYNPGKQARSFYLKKMFVLLAGPFVNLVLAFLIMIGAVGNIEGLKVAAIKDVQLTSTGIAQGDIIRNINDERVFCVEDIEDLLVVGMENSVTFLNERYEKETVSFFCESAELEVTFDYSFENKVKGAGRSFKKMVEIARKATGKLFSDEKNVAESVAYNPYSEMESGLRVPQSFLRGMNRFLMITAVFSFSIAVFNLLPIVILDGFKILTAFLSVVINRKLSENACIWIGIAGVIFSILLFF